MGCSNTNVKDEVPNNKKLEENNPNLQNANEIKNNNDNIKEDKEYEEDEDSDNSKNKKNQDEESSRLDDENDSMYKIKKFDPNHLLSEESKGILNLYNGNIRKPQICIVPNNSVFYKKGPEDKNLQI